MRTRKQPSKSDPWSSFAAPHTSSPKRVMGPELFLDVQEKGTYLAGRCSHVCDWTVAFDKGGSLLLAVSFKNLCPSATFYLSFLPLFSLKARILIPRPVPISRTSCHLYRAESEPQNNPFFASGTYCYNPTGDR